MRHLAWPCVDALGHASASALSWRRWCCLRRAPSRPRPPPPAPTGAGRPGGHGGRARPHPARPDAVGDPGRSLVLARPRGREPCRPGRRPPRRADLSTAGSTTPPHGPVHHRARPTRRVLAHFDAPWPPRPTAWCRDLRHRPARQQRRSAHDPCRGTAWRLPARRTDGHPRLHARDRQLRRRLPGHRSPSTARATAPPCPASPPFSPIRSRDIRVRSVRGGAAPGRADPARLRPLLARPLAPPSAADRCRRQLIGRSGVPPGHRLDAGGQPRHRRPTWLARRGETAAGAPGNCRALETPAGRRPTARPAVRAHRPGRPGRRGLTGEIGAQLVRGDDLLRLSGLHPTAGTWVDTSSPFSTANATNLGDRSDGRAAPTTSSSTTATSTSAGSRQPHVRPALHLAPRPRRPRHGGRGRQPDRRPLHGRSGRSRAGRQPAPGHTRVHPFREPVQARPPGHHHGAAGVRGSHPTRRSSPLCSTGSPTTRPSRRHPGPVLLPGAQGRQRGAGHPSPQGRAVGRRRVITPARRSGSPRHARNLTSLSAAASGHPAVFATLSDLLLAHREPGLRPVPARGRPRRLHPALRGRTRISFRWRTRAPSPSPRARRHSGLGPLLGALPGQGAWSRWTATSSPFPTGTHAP